MIRLMKNASLAAAALGAVVVAASPASAQSFSHGWGTGNVLPFSYRGSAPPQRHAAVRSHRNSAYAMAPRDPDPVTGPGSIGTGSVGYNQLLMTH